MAKPDEETLQGPVIADEFIEFLVSKNIKPICPSCGHDELFIAVESDEQFAAQGKSQIATFNEKTKQVKVDHNGVILYTSAICENCGYVRSYLSSVFHAWNNERKKGDKQ